jgi:DNA-directed RNA polymerase subunit L
MNKISNIEIKILNYKNNQDALIQQSFLKYKLSGKNINYVIANTIRRTISEDIPIYSFDEFKFEKNTSVLHNNYLITRLKQLPIFGIKNNIDFIDKNNDILLVPDDLNEYNNDIDPEPDLNMDIDKEVSSSTLKQLTMYVNYKNDKNDKNEIIRVTTDNAKFYFNQKLLVKPYKTPIELLKLHPNQEISFSAISNIGTESTHAMYSCVSRNFYNEVNENEYDMECHSSGQITEKRILEVAFINIQRKLDNFHNIINSDSTKIKFTGKEDEGIIVLNGESYTFGNLIGRGMQEHDNISFAGSNVPHPSDKTVHFHFKLKKGTIKKVLEDVIEYYKSLFEKIAKSIAKELK